MPDTEKYKQFVVFKISEYYPSGGLDDIVDSFDFIHQARMAYPSGGDSTIQIFDRVEGVRVREDDPTYFTPDNIPGSWMKLK